MMEVQYIRLFRDSQKTVIQLLTNLNKSNGYGRVHLTSVLIRFLEVEADTNNWAAFITAGLLRMVVHIASDHDTYSECSRDQRKIVHPT